MPIFFFFQLTCLSWHQSSSITCTNLITIFFPVPHNHILHSSLPRFYASHRMQPITIFEFLCLSYHPSPFSFLLDILRSTPPTPPPHLISPTSTPAYLITVHASASHRHRLWENRTGGRPTTARRRSSGPNPDAVTNKIFDLFSSCLKRSYPLIRVSGLSSKSSVGESFIISSLACPVLSLGAAKKLPNSWLHPHFVSYASEQQSSFPTLIRSALHQSLSEMSQHSDSSPVCFETLYLSILKLLNF